MSEEKETYANPEEPLLSNVINWGMSDDGIYQEFVDTGERRRKNDSVYDKG